MQPRYLFNRTEAKGKKDARQAARQKLTALKIKTPGQIAQDIETRGANMAGLRELLVEVMENQRAILEFITDPLKE